MEIITTFRICGLTKMTPLCHTTNATVAPEKLTGAYKLRHSEITWPPRSYDLTPKRLYFFGAILGGYYEKF